jgi:O-antigen/teichoic acid export membrane protein
MPENAVVDAEMSIRPSMRERRAPISVTVAMSMAGKAAELGTLIVLAIVVPRVLGPADYGRLTVPLTIVMVGSLALTLGGPMTLARFVPAAPADQQVALARRLGARLARGRAVQLAFIGLVAASLTIWDSERFEPGLMLLIVAGLALNVVATLVLQVALGLGRTGAWSARYPLQNAVLVAGILLLHATGGASAAMVAIVIAAGVAVVFALVVTARVTRAPSAPAEIPPGAIRFGVVLAAGAAVTQTTQRGGVLAVAMLGGSDSETGHAALAIGVALGITYAVQQAFTVTLPHVSRASPSDGGDDDRAEVTMRRLAGVMLAALIPVAAVAALAVTTVVPAVFGEPYRDASEAFVPALAMVVVAPVNALAVQTSALRLRPRATLIAATIGAIAFVVVAIAAIPAGGAEGGPAAMLCGAAASAVASLVLLPGAIGRRIAVASLTGAALVLTLGVLA